MNRNIAFYIGIIGFFGLCVWLILEQGQLLETEKVISGQSILQIDHKISLFGELLKNVHNAFAVLILQIIVIMLTARFFGWLSVQIGQPTVIGEIIAGIVLGPSLLGLLFPEFFDFLFPKSSFVNLQFLSKVGLILFMFIIGMEMDMDELGKKSKKAILISHSSIIFSYFLGIGSAYFLYKDYAPANISFSAFACFMGIAMSITAFPVLARILQEKDMTKSSVGSIVITCAAIDDITAWCLLAIVIAIVKAGSIWGALITIMLSSAYIILMLCAVRPFLNNIASRYFTRETVNKSIIAVIFAILLLSSYITEVIGIHALFGAFMAGVIIPSNPEFRYVLVEKIEDVSLVLLLPLFFTFTGLRTHIGLLSNPHLWMVCLIVIALAVTGKFLGSAVAARFVGRSWKDSLIIGAMMNTRGLIELVVLNIGYDMGVLSPEIFAVMVLMALSTTFMTSPAIDIINYFTKVKPEVYGTKIESGYKILISFGAPKAGARLLQLVEQMMLSGKDETRITALHLTPSADISLQEANFFEKEGFAPILHTAKEIGLQIQTTYKASNEISNEIVNFANQGDFDLMLAGSSHPLFSSDETGGKVKNFFEDARCSVGVFLDKGFEQIRKVLLIVEEPSDYFLAFFGKKLLQNPAKELTVLDSNLILQNDPTIWGMKAEQSSSQLLSVETSFIEKDFSERFDLVLMSLDCWNKLREKNTKWLKYSPSILILKK